MKKDSEQLSICTRDRLSSQLTNSSLYWLCRKLICEVLFGKELFGLPRKAYFPIHIRLDMDTNCAHGATRGLFIAQYLLFERLTHAFARKPLYFVFERRGHIPTISNRELSASEVMQLYLMGR